MKKFYYFGANWRDKDVHFLNELGLGTRVEKGADSFTVEEGDIYHKIIAYYSQKDPLFGKTRPKDFYTCPATVFFP